MNEIIAVLILAGIISIGTIIISYRYVKAKLKVEETRWEKDIERPDYIQLDREVANEER